MEIDECKLHKMFEMVYGEMSGACRAETSYDEEDKVSGIDVMEGENLCWCVSVQEIMFAYLTKDWS